METILDVDTLDQNKTLSTTWFYKECHITQKPMTVLIGSLFSQYYFGVFVSNSHETVFISQKEENFCMKKEKKMAWWKIDIIKL